MKLVVGLGNPGARYARTRHNAGCRVVERFAEIQRIPLERERFEGRFGRARIAWGEGGELDVGVLLPQTFMNLSGDAVAAALRGLPVADPSFDLLVVLDDVDLPFGRLRLRAAGGAGGHHGLAHVLERLGTSDLPRLRFGVGRPPGVRDTTDHVLSPFSSEEERALPERLEAAARAIELALVGGPRGRHEPLQPRALRRPLTGRRAEAIVRSFGEHYPLGFSWIDRIDRVLTGP